MAPTIEHVIVLALENRSYDHMLGFLPHPDRVFDGLLSGGPYTNPAWSSGPPVAAAPAAKTVLPLDPDHAHEAVMNQLSLKNWGPLRKATMEGFVKSYEEKGRGLVPPTFEGLVGPIANWWARRQAKEEVLEGRGPLVMRCQPPSNIPVLGELALQFGVCSKWFSSVPGETWPNRNFMHAATSDGETNNDIRFYGDPTVFERLEQHGKRWHIYYDDTPQVWAFNRLWLDPARKRNWFTFSRFADHVARGELPHYTFIEPNHRPPVHAPDRQPVAGEPPRSSSQHPGNNLVDNAAYDTFVSTAPGDFERGEVLIATIYEALRANPTLFERSIFLITYDEHGGLYDHVPPPTDVPAPGDKPNVDLLGRVVARLLRRKSTAFDFTTLGVRVPALIVSPFVPPGAVSADMRDHASIPATLRAVFMPDAEPLTKRDAWALPFHTLLTLDSPRSGPEMPDLSRHLAAAPDTARDLQVPPQPEPTGVDVPIPPYYRDFVELADMVSRELPTPNPPGTADDRTKARYATVVFTEEADRARAPGD